MFGPFEGSICHSLSDGSIVTILVFPKDRTPIELVSNTLGLFYIHAMLLGAARDMAHLRSTIESFGFVMEQDHVVRSCGKSTARYHLVLPMSDESRLGGQVSGLKVAIGRRVYLFLSSHLETLLETLSKTPSNTFLEA